MPLRPTLISIAIFISLSACNKAPTNSVEQPQTQAEAKQPLSRATLDGIIEQHTKSFLQQQPTLGTALGLDD